jgi:hypothetical protein
MKGWKVVAFRDEGLYFLMEIIFTLLFKTLWDLYSFILLLSTKSFLSRGKPIAFAK